MRQPFAKDTNNNSDDKKYEYDIFISYRRKPSKEEAKDTPGKFIHRHSTSLARSLASELRDYGYKVFFDCWDRTHWKEALERSRHFIVLLTGYSFDKENDTSQDGKGVEKGMAFRDEVEFVLKGLEKDNWEKERVHWINVDEGFDPNEPTFGERIIKTGIPIRKLDTGRPLLLDSINDSENPFFPRIQEEQGCTTKKKIAIWVIAAVALLATALVLTKYYDNKLVQYNDSLTHYDELLNETPIVFVGGGTLKNYLLTKGVDVNNYKPGIYIHLPSTSAWSVLLDDPNDSSRYSPVVISTGEIDESELDSTQVSHFKDKGRRILQYYFTRIPLVIQLRNYRGPEYKNGTITVDELKGLLNNKKNILYATSPQSGTKKAYLSFDNSLKKFIGPVKNVFRPESYDQNDLKHTQIYFANELYCVPPDTNVISLKLCKGIDTASVGLYLYVVGAFDAKTGRYELDASVRKCMEWLNIFVGDSKLEQPSEEKGNLIIPLN